MPWLYGTADAKRRHEQYWACWFLEAAEAWIDYHGRCVPVPGPRLMICGDECHVKDGCADDLQLLSDRTETDDDLFALHLWHM